MSVKDYLKKNGIKLGIIVLAVALLAGVGAAVLKGNAGPLRNTAGAMRTPMQRMVSSVSEWLEGIYGRIYEYDRLVAENERLRAELVEAQEEARDGQSAIEENDRLRNLLEFKEKHSDMTLESAKIVAWSSSNWGSSFTISKGAAAELEVGDCVITEYGVLVGQITELGENWATVSTVIDVSTSIGAMVFQNGSTGLVVGDFAMMQDGCAKLTYLAEGASVFAGDDVMTSGSGGTFPAGLVVGKVKSVQAEAGGQIEYGEVEPGCDLGSLVQVFVVKDFEVVE